jgi:hypothetical protein
VESTERIARSVTDSERTSSIFGSGACCENGVHDELCVQNSSGLVTSSVLRLARLAHTDAHVKGL